MKRRVGIFSLIALIAFIAILPTIKPSGRDHPIMTIGAVVGLLAGGAIGAGIGYAIAAGPIVNFGTNLVVYAAPGVGSLVGLGLGRRAEIRFASASEVGSAAGDAITRGVPPSDGGLASYDGSKRTAAGDVGYAVGGLVGGVAGCFAGGVVGGPILSSYAATVSGLAGGIAGVEVGSHYGERIAKSIADRWSSRTAKDDANRPH